MSSVGTTNQALSTRVSSTLNLRYPAMFLTLLVSHRLMSALNVVRFGSWRKLDRSANASAMSVISTVFQFGIVPYWAYWLLGHIPPTALWRRKLNLKSKFESNSSYCTFKR